MAVAKERIALFGQAREFRIRDPCVLKELKLARNVCIETNKMQSARRFIWRGRFERFFRR